MFSNQEATVDFGKSRVHGVVGVEVSGSARGVSRREEVRAVTASPRPLFHPHWRHALGAFRKSDQEGEEGERAGQVGFGVFRYGVEGVSGQGKRG